MTRESEESTPTNVYDDVLAFHRRFNLPVGDEPHLPSDADLRFRFRFLEEELAEVWLSLETLKRQREAGEKASDEELAHLLDGLVDLVYVAVGFAIWAGLPFDAAWRAVQRANMTKVQGATDRHSQDVIKPPGWEPPEQAIAEAIRRARERTPA